MLPHWILTSIMEDATPSHLEFFFAFQTLLQMHVIRKFRFFEKTYPSENKSNPFSDSMELI